jgi:ankyrin repeat protein
MMRLLIHRGARINETFGGSAALRSAAVNGRVASVRFLLARGADPNTSTEAGTLLHAVRTDGQDTEIARLLAQAGAHE